MKTIMTCVCMLWVAGAQATQPGDMMWLPLGTRARIIAQSEKEVSHFSLSIKTPSMLWPAGQDVPYTNSMGSLENVMKTNMTSFFGSVITTNDAGSNAIFLFKIYSPSGQILGWNENNGHLALTNFTVVFDSSNNLVIPHQSLLYSTNTGSSGDWSLTVYMPVSGAAVGVERVDYVETNLDTGQLSVYSTRNGVDDVCPLSTLSDGVLYIYPILVNTEDWTWIYRPLELVLHYSVAGGQYDAFDMATGNKIRSTVVRLSMGMVEDTPCVSVKGWPGTNVVIETSHDLSTWTYHESIPLDSTGQGTCTNLGSTMPLYVRGRLDPPPE